MLIRNFRSSMDEQSKRELAKQILQVEVDNEAELERRIGSYQNKAVAPAVPPQYRTKAELTTDLMTQEKNAMDFLESLGFDYADSSAITQYISKKGKLVEFNASSPFIKADLAKKYNPKLLNSQFMQGYLEKYFENLEVNFGHKFGMDKIQLASVEQLVGYIPTLQLINELDIAIDNAFDDVAQSGVGNNVQLIKQILAGFANTLPNADTINELRTLSPNELGTALQRIARAIERNALPSQNELIQLTNRIQGFANDGGISEAEQVKESKKLLARLGQMSASNLSEFKKSYASVKGDLEENKQKIKKNLITLLDAGKRVPLGGVIDIHDVDQEAKKLKIQNIIASADSPAKLQNIFEQLSGTLPDFLTYMRDGGYLALNGAILQKWLRPDGRDEFQHAIYQAVVDTIDWTIDDLDLAGFGTVPTSRYTLDTHQYYENPRDTTIGFGSKKSITKKIHEHFVDDEKFLKKLAKQRVVAKAKEEVYDSEDEKELASDLRRHMKITEPTEKKLLGEGFIHKRIPIKKVIGAGVQLEERPTYRTFGKYVMHIPFLMNDNVLNLKYPSLGSIPSIKPITISDEYKEFIIEVMNSGKVNDKQYSYLPEHEQKHFERITKGAGLIEKFNLKRKGDDEEKKDIDRFNLLRGNYLAGNNSDSLIKELRGLVVKFMSENRIQRGEGMDLLMELSVI